MTYEQRKQERQALIEHLLAQDWNVFGTLKFVNGRTIGRSSADKLLRSYWNRIDRMFFGKAAERQNMRVPRWCFAHEGSDSENYHIHFALQAPIPDVDHMCCIAERSVGAASQSNSATVQKLDHARNRQNSSRILSHTGILALGLSDTFLDELCLG